MVQTTPCPAIGVLQRLLVGDISEAEATALEQHLLNCERCLQCARSLPTGDRLVEALQSHASGEAVEINDRVAGLMHRLQQLPVARNEQGLSQGATTAEQVASTSPVQDGTQELPACLAPAQAPDELGRLGPYRVLHLLGQGGMGVVLQAEDTQLQRVVALKVMRRDLSQNPKARERFLREARAAAAVESEHIVTIYQVGEDSGVPYLAMQLLEGEPLDRWLQRNPSPTMPQLVRIGREIALGLAAAHERGLVHRDVKPANIFLVSGGAMSGEWSGSHHSPPTTRHSPTIKLLDFGLARAAADDVHLTQSGTVVGTPAYMAPEQARGGNVDQRSDLFSLGVVLYRLSTGRLPFQGDSTLAVLSALAVDTPRPVRELKPDVPSALAELIMRLLLKNPAERPACARVVAAKLADIERNLSSNLPSMPRATRAAVVRWLLPVAAAVLVVAWIVPQVLWRIRDKNGALKAEVPLQPDDRIAVVPPGAPGSSPLDRLRRADVPPYELRVAGDGDPERAPPYLVAVLGDSRWRHWSSVESVACTPDGASVVSSAADGTVHVWDIGTGEVRHILRPGGPDRRGGATVAAVSPDGTLLATAHTSGLRLWELPSGKALRNLPGPGVTILAASFCPRPELLLASIESGGNAVLWEPLSSKKVRTLTSGEKTLRTLACDAQGKHVAAGLDDGTIRVWNAATGEVVSTFPAHDSTVRCLTFSPEGTALASAATGDLLAKFWEPGSGKELLRVQDTHRVLTVAFSPDGKRLATAGNDPTIRIWDRATAAPLQQFRGHALDVLAVAFGPNGQRVVSGGLDGMVRVWDVAGGRSSQAFSEPVGRMNAVAFQPRGDRLATGSEDGRTMVWDVSTRLMAWSVRPAGWKSVADVTFSPDGQRVARAMSGKNGVIVYDADGKEVLTLAGHLESGVRSVAWSRDGTRLATAGGDGTVKVWDAVTGKEQLTIQGHAGRAWRVAWRPDGLRLATGGADGTARIWDAATGKEVMSLAAGPQVMALTFNPDGDQLVTAGPGSPLRLWNADDGRERFTVVAATPVSGADFSPDGNTIAAAGAFGVVFLIDARTGKVAHQWQLPGRIQGVRFAPDGRHLATANGNGTVYLLRLTMPGIP